MDLREEETKRKKNVLKMFHIHKKMSFMLLKPKTKKNRTSLPFLYILFYITKYIIIIFCLLLLLKDYL